MKTKELFEECKKQIPCAKTIERLIKEGADVNQLKDDITSLHTLVISDRITETILKLYLENGFDIEKKDFCGRSVLERICLQSFYNESIIKLVYHHVENNLCQKIEMGKYLILNPNIRVSELELLMKNGYIHLNEETFMSFFERQDFDFKTVEMLLSVYPKLDLFYKNKDGKVLVEYLFSSPFFCPEILLILIKNFGKFEKENNLDKDIDYDSIGKTVAKGVEVLIKRQSIKNIKGYDHDAEKVFIGSGNNKIFANGYFLNSDQSKVSIYFKEKFDSYLATYYTIDVIKGEKVSYKFFFEKPIDPVKCQRDKDSLVFQVIPYESPFCYKTFI